MKFLVNMNKNLRIGFLYCGFIVLIIVGIVQDSLILVGLGFATLILLIYTNMKYSDKHFKSLENTTNEQLKKIDFNFTSHFINPDYLTGIGIDTTKRQLIVLNRPNQNADFNYKTFNFDEILESAIIEDDVTVTRTSKTGLLGGALIGGAIAGGVGAVVGGMASNKTSSDSVLSMNLTLVVDDLLEPIHEVNFIHSPVPLKKSTKLYQDINKEVYKWHKTISVILKRNNYKESI